MCVRMAPVAAKDDFVESVLPFMWILRAERRCSAVAANIFTY